MPWDQTREGLSHDVDQAVSTAPASQTHRAPKTAEPSPTPPLTPSTGSLGDQLGSAGLLGNVSTSFANVSKGWHEMLSPEPAPPAPPGHEAVQQAEKVAKDIRTVQQTLGGIMSLINLPKDMLDIGFANLTNPIAAMLPSMPSATITTLYVGTPHAHTHPPSLIPPAPPIPLPSMGPVTLGTCVKVLINSLPAARVKDLGYAFTCGGFVPIFQIKTGSSNVFIGGHRAARLGDVCVACVQGQSRTVDTGAASAALKAIEALGMIAGLAGVVADAAEAAVQDNAAMASAMALSAAMGAAQLAADAVAMALSQAMGKDPGLPPSIGALVTGHPNVLIGGFPMIDIPNPINMILERLKAFKAKSPPDNGGCGKAGEPVDIVTGDNVDDNIDYESGPPQPFRWVRYYSSALRNQCGPLGYGHRHEYQQELEFDADGVRYINEKGETIGFAALAGNQRAVFSNGFALHRVNPELYRLESTSRPTMDFWFQDVHSPAPLIRMGSARSALHFLYDDTRKLVAITDSQSRVFTLRYDEYGRIAELRHANDDGHPDQLLAAYRYDAAGNLVEWTDALSHSSTFAYDARRNMTRKTDRLGYSFHYEYDKAGRCVHTYGDDGLYDVSLQFMPEQQCTLLTHSDGGCWTYIYNESGTITQIIDPYGGIQTRTTDEKGRVTEEIEPSGRITQLLYDASGAHIGRCDSLGYNFLPWEQDPHPQNPLALKLPETPLEWEYGRLSAITQSDDPGPEDLRELPRYVAEFRARIIASGALPADPGTARKFYDARGRLAEEKDTRGGAQRWRYDPNGNVSEYTDPAGAVHRYEYASWNLLHRKIDPSGGAVTFQYTPREKIRMVIDAGGTTTEYSHDYKDRLVSVSRHGVIREEYRYDIGDNLIEKVDGHGETLLTFEPGPHKLPLVRRLASGETHSFAYDDRGRITEAATDELEAQFKYTPYGRVLLDQRNGKGVTHKYAEEKLAETAVFGRFITKYKTNSKGWLIIVDPAGGSHQARSTGGMVFRILSNGSSEISYWNATGRCTLKAHQSRVKHYSPWVRTYKYSPTGNLTTVKDTLRGTSSYEYDSCGRLIVEHLPKHSPRQFVYDVAGNLIQQPGLSDVILNDGNRLSTANGDRFTYNGRNHISRRERGSSVTVYDYNSADMLVHVGGAMLDWQCRYDPLGRRVSKSWDNGTVEFFWDQDRLAAEIGRDGALRIYIYADPFALVPFMFVDYENEEAPPESGSRYFIFTNQIGVPVRVEDDQGRAAWSARIDPYGSAIIDPGNRIELALRFPGHYHDAETGLFYNRYRYYSPELGRYLQSDPIGLKGGMNVYGYAGGAPLTKVDLIGHHPDQPEGNSATKGGNAAGTATEEEPEPPSPPTPPPRLTRQQGQKIIDDVHNAYPGKKGVAVSGMTETKDGTLIFTSSDNIRKDQRKLIQQMQQPGGPLEGQRVRVPDDPKDPDHIVGGAPPLQNAPNPDRSGDAEQKGIQTTQDPNYTNSGDATRQWSSGGASHGGAACDDCEAAQNQNGVVNETGFQSQGGRYDRGGNDPYQSGNTIDDDGHWQ